ncbi:MAG: membrane protein insertase YidC [Clostridia bacterium]|nr:membrane protein insertase YidC [Clostridia bacterium]
MELFNVLASVNIAVFGETYPVFLDWVGKIIKFLITSVGSVGLGIILFSLVLKIIVLPFDIYQRISMRKQNIKMKENQDRMEKLQKQYANNKDLYNQKVMEMYKESGISMFSSCLPMILSMVIFFVAIGAFNAYSQYSNIENYNTLVEAYNAKILEYAPDFEEQSLLDGKVKIVENGEVLRVESTENGKVVFVEAAMPENNTFASDSERLAYVRDYDKKSYQVDIDKAVAAGYVTAEMTAEEVAAYFQGVAQDAVVVAYTNTVAPHTQFLWIKNIWVTDAVYTHPVLEYTNFKTEIEREDFDVAGSKVSLTGISAKTNAYESATYEVVTAKLSAQKAEGNGWFILIALSIATILLQQWISNRAQKEQQKYSTVDGQGAQQQKMTMIIMTGMFAVFSFMYSSAFSIYLIVSNVFSLISTVVINKLVDNAAEKAEAKALQEKHNQRFPGRRKTETDTKKKNK